MTRGGRSGKKAFAPSAPLMAAASSALLSSTGSTLPRMAPRPELTATEVRRAVLARLAPSAAACRVTASLLSLHLAAE